MAFLNKCLIGMLIASAAIFFTACRKGKIVQLNELHRVGDIYFNPENQKPYSGKFAANCENNGIKESGIMRNGVRHGKITFYREDGTIKEILIFYNGISPSIMTRKAIRKDTEILLVIARMQRAYQIEANKFLALKEDNDWHKIGFSNMPDSDFFTFEVISDGQTFLAKATLKKNIENAKTGDYITINEKNVRTSSNHSIQALTNW